METEHKIRLEWIAQYATYKDWTQAISNPDSVKEQEQIWYENVVAASSSKPQYQIQTRSQLKKETEKRSQTKQKETYKPDDKNITKGVELVWQTTDTDGNVTKLCYDFHNGNGCKRGDECPHLHEEQCPLKGCRKKHPFAAAHKNLLSLLKPKGKGKGKGKGGKGNRRKKA